VPAAAVIQERLAVFVVIGRKGFVDCFFIVNKVWFFGQSKLLIMF